MLNDNLNFQVRWSIDKNDIIFHLIGQIGAFEYMTLGLSKDDTETKFDAADAAVVWIDDSGKGHAEDFFLENNVLCENGHGMCPDVVHEGSENNIEFINATTSKSATTIVFKRPLKAEDQVYDQNIYTDGPQAILWAVGSVKNKNLIEPPRFRSRGNLLLDFGRDPIWNCPQINKEEEKASHTADVAPKLEIHCPNNHAFRVQLGPSLSSQNEQVWYINGLPAPELTIKRGTSYNFIIEGGKGPNKRHPFYITDSTDGGFSEKFSEGKMTSERIFAGVTDDLNTKSFLPTAEGRLCEWNVSTSDPEGSVRTSQLDSTNALTLKCEPGDPGNLIWTPNSGTPDVVYYQSFSQRNYGGKIKIVDFCDETNSRYYLEVLRNAEDELRSNEGPFSDIKGYRSKSKLELEDSSEESEKTVSIRESGVKVNENEEPNNGEKMSDAIESMLLFENEATEIPEIKSMPMKIEKWKRTDFPEMDKIREKEEFLVRHKSNEKRSELPHPFVADSALPHDDSERSDRNIQRQNSRVSDTPRKSETRVNVYNSNEQLASSQLSASLTPAQNLGPIIVKQNSGFKPHFEGGFIPLVLNPVKERELHLPQFPSHLRRPHKPFLFNESIPFHGTFKPGVPDFSGFNISSYSHEEPTYPANNVQDNIPMVSAPKPHLLQNQISPINLQGGMFKRPKRPLHPQYVFPHPPLPRTNYHHTQSHGPSLNLRIPNIHDELDQVSSQRVQVMLQSIPKEKNSPNLIRPFRNMPLQIRNQQASNLIHSPPIQRRPDIVEGETLSNIRPFRRPLPSNFNKNVELQRIPPELQINPSRSPFDIRFPLPVNKPPFKELMDKNRRRTPIGFERLPNDLVQSKRRVPTFPQNQAKTITPTSLDSFEDLEITKKNENIEKVDSESKQNEKEAIPSYGISDTIESGDEIPSSQLFPTNSHLSVQQSHPLPVSVNQKDREVSIEKISASISRPQPSLTVIKTYKPEVIPRGEKISNKTLDQLQKDSSLSHNKPSSLAAELDAFPSEEKKILASASDDSNNKPEIDMKTAETSKSDEKHSSNKESLDSNDEYLPAFYSDYEAPFGARLKTRPNGNRYIQKITTKPTPKIPLNFSRKPQLASPIDTHSDINSKLPVSHSVTRYGTENSTTQPKFVVKYLSNEDKENLPKMTVITPKPSDFEIKRKEDKIWEELFKSDTFLSPQTENIYVSSENYPGRKNLLPDNSNKTYTDFSVRAPEDINLPHISESPPSHDNGTDFSILNHVLFIIGGQKDSGKMDRSSDA